MAFSYFWNMFYLHRNKIIFCAFFLLFFQSNAFSQIITERKAGINLPNYDYRKMHYGFYLGLNGSTFKAEHSADYVRRLANPDSALTANPKFTPGFLIGFVLSRHLGDYFDLRFLPGVGFYTRQIEFRQGDEVTNKEIASTTVQLPFLLKYSAKRRKNSRLYFVGGITPMINVGGSKRDETVEDRVRIDKNNFQVEYGVGIDLFYPFFKFAPEIRVAHGSPNVLIRDQNIYSSSFRGLSIHSVTLYLNFE